MLINDILDLSKIESGTVSWSMSARFASPTCTITSNGRSVTSPRPRELAFVIGRRSRMPKGLLTDSKRLQQVLKNLLSNAFKFTASAAMSR